MTAETSEAVEAPAVDPEARIKLLRNLAHGRKWTAARAASGLSEDVARAVAEAAGWPDMRAVKQAWMGAIAFPDGPPSVPAPREPAVEEPPVEPEPDPALDDHPAVERALSLARLVREKDADAVARLTGSWSPVELLETALALAALVPVGVEPEVALEWLDGPALEWPDVVVSVEAGRWDAGARDATAEAARAERDRRGS